MIVGPGTNQEWLEETEKWARIAQQERVLIVNRRDDDRRLIGILEARLDPERAPIDELLELVALYLGPRRNEDEAQKAATLLETILEREPANSHAAAWYAMVALHFLMDEPALRRALDSLRHVIESATGGLGEAYLLAGQVEQQLGAPAAEVSELYEASVRSEPSWFLNRYLLAEYLWRRGQSREALEQLRRARANIIDPVDDWSPERREFEVQITGRTGFGAADSVDEALREIEGSGS